MQSLLSVVPGDPYLHIKTLSAVEGSAEETGRSRGLRVHLFIILSQRFQTVFYDLHTFQYLIPVNNQWRCKPDLIAMRWFGKQAIVL